jgi:hypothetical protein
MLAAEKWKETRCCSSHMISGKAYVLLSNNKSTARCTGRRQSGHGSVAVLVTVVVVVVVAVASLPCEIVLFVTP